MMHGKTEADARATFGEQGIDDNKDGYLWLMLMIGGIILWLVL